MGITITHRKRKIFMLKLRITYIKCSRAVKSLHVNITISQISIVCFGITPQKSLEVEKCVFSLLHLLDYFRK